MLMVHIKIIESSTEAAAIMFLRRLLKMFFSFNFQNAAAAFYVFTKGQNQKKGNALS